MKVASIVEALWCLKRSNPLELLLARLSLLGFGGLGAKAIDVLLQVFDLFSLFVIGLLCLPNFLCAKLQKLTVAAFVGVQHLISYLNDVRTHFVQERSVVADDQYCI